MITNNSYPSLCLGTVQFGMNYGINNFLGQPSEDAVHSMLSLALEQHISYLDTAAAYGDAEVRLGSYGVQQRFPGTQVISKLHPQRIQQTGAAATQQVIHEVEESLNRLNLDCLYGYLLHNPLNFYNPAILEGLRSCRERGLIRHFGVSIYEVDHALDVVTSKQVDMIQIPYNIFDTRLDGTDFFQIARENGVRVFARSPFLQGLILMENEIIPPHLSLARDYLQTFDRIIAKYGFDRSEAALLFAYTHPSIDAIVFGVDSCAHIAKNLATIARAASFAACREELAAAFPDVTRAIIIPSLWASKS